MRKLSALVGVFALVALASACGVSVGPHHTLSGPSVAREISSNLAKHYSIKPPPAVSCPDGIEASKGTTFVCTTVLFGDPLDLNGTVTGSNGHYQVVPRDAIIPIPALVNFLQTNIATTTRVKPWTVDCGAKQYAVVAVGGKITCWATSPGLPGPRKVITTIVDPQGRVTYSLS
jgi:Domain of unknown function (DUF4333)